MSSLTFSKYPSIENHYQSKFIDLFEEVVPAETTCVFKEKAHGANLQVYVDRDGNVRPARRGAFLKEGENFNGAWDLVKRDSKQFQMVYNNVAALYPQDIPAISICGEIIGGEYPGFKPKKPVARVQKGVFYAPDIHFYAFDIRLVGPDEELPFLPWSLTKLALDAAHVLRAQELGSMPAGEVVTQLREHNTIAKYPPKFESTVWESIGGLPKLPNNWSEGYVICPEPSYFSRNGSRMIIKYKNPGFAEVQKTPKEMPLSADAIELVVAPYIDPTALRNRLDNVMSKESWELTDNKKRGLIVKALVTDVMEDLEKEHPTLDAKKAHKRLGGACGKFIRDVVTGTL